MPFKSKRQMRYLFSQKPEVAREFAQKSKERGITLSTLPEKVKKKKSKYLPGRYRK